MGAPRTKKTSNRLAKLGKTKRTIVLPSKAWSDWVKVAHIVGNHGEGCDEFAWTPKDTLPMLDYNCTALIYRDADRGDAVGYYQGLADLLEKRGVIVNDSCITQWDGSRLLIDRKNPRIELTLTEVAA
jgi:hypothetical protein